MTGPSGSDGLTGRPFDLGRIPRVAFGAGRFRELPDLVARHGRRALLVTGSRSFRATERWSWLLGELDGRGVDHREMEVAGEPSPEAVDEAVERFRGARIEVVVGIGGGSVLDTAKAVAGLLRTGTSVLDHLELVGRGIPYPGPAVPLVAVPTTAGTGSEATRNAVVSRVGPDGFKRSFRDERLVAADAVVDPDLLAGASPEVVASNGLDAITQLVESYVSLRASPFTEALALSGLAAARDSFLPFWRETGADGDADARAGMAYAALLSGICLANAGLGVVHGLAAPLGGAIPVPHGAACGAMLVAGVEVNLAALAERAPGSPALERYATLGRLLARQPATTPGPEARAELIRWLGGVVSAVRLQGLGSWGLTIGVFDRVVGGSRGGSMATNPIELTDVELAQVLRASQ
ncbi:MAG TPA: iron-containing alcohol dehydrogenase [Candidatus Limnocylindrales bacterium]|nr:iron-containing alcohol dehydrogenase [Candidatus Limnocylindrales bacterium]